MTTLAPQFSSISPATVTPAFLWEDRPSGCTHPVWRYSRNPLFGYEAIPGTQAVYNSAVVTYGNGYVGLFRADQMTGLPDLHLGRSSDGLKWEFEPRPFRLALAPGLGPHEYAYDPRICQIGTRYYITWCGGYHGPTISLAWTDDFVSFHQLENAFLPYNRNGVLFPRKIGGNYAMLSRPSDRGHTPFGDIFYSESPDLVFWGKHRLAMTSGSLWWESVKIGAGPVPLETAEGWLLVYHGVRSSCNGFVYSLGVALLDRDEPWKVRARLPGPILLPQAPYEVTGFVPNVVFPCALLHDEPTGRLAIYYGAADTHIALAFAHRDEVLALLLQHKVP